MNEINKEMWRATNPREGATVEIKIANLDTAGNKIERKAMLIRIDDSKWAELSKSILDILNKTAK